MPLAADGALRSAGQLGQRRPCFAPVATERRFLFGGPAQASHAGRLGGVAPVPLRRTEVGRAQAAAVRRQPAHPRIGAAALSAQRLGQPRQLRPLPGLAHGFCTTLDGAEVGRWQPRRRRAGVHAHVRARIACDWWRELPEPVVSIGRVYHDGRRRRRGGGGWHQQRRRRVLVRGGHRWCPAIARGGGDNTAAVATSAVTGANAQLPPATPFAARPSPSGTTGQRPSARPSAPRDTRNAGPVGWLHPQRTTRTERATETHDGVKIKERVRGGGVLATRSIAKTPVDTQVRHVSPEKHSNSKYWGGVTRERK